MAPQMGPNDAPTMVKKPIRFSATPVTARTIATVMPAMVDDMRFTPGIMVEKLLPAMKAQKQADGMEAMVNRKNMAVASGPPMTDDHAVVAEPCMLRDSAPWRRPPRAAAGRRRTSTAQRDADQAAHPDVVPVAAVHAEIRARRARGGEEADDDLDQQRERQEGVRARTARGCAIPPRVWKKTTRIITQRDDVQIERDLARRTGCPSRRSRPSV